MVAEKGDREPTPFGISPEHDQPLCRQPPPTTASRSTAYFPEADARHEPACCSLTSPTPSGAEDRRSESRRRQAEPRGETVVFGAYANRRRPSRPVTPRRNACPNLTAGARCWMRTRTLR